jgi:hypothetical protein
MLIFMITLYGLMILNFIIIPFIEPYFPSKILLSVLLLIEFFICMKISKEEMDDYAIAGFVILILCVISFIIFAATTW